MSDDHLPSTMSGWLLTGHGGPERLSWRTDLVVPRPGVGEVLIRVHATSVNNTDINTRVGWYSKSVRGGTEGAQTQSEDGGWAGALTFPRIQGADLVGRIVAVGPRVAAARIGERVVCRAMYPPPDAGPFDLMTRGSERDGAFAEYATAEAQHALTVTDASQPDEVLGILPCAYSTAEGMLDRVGLDAERVLVTGASGGVGLAAVQLAKLRGADVTAMAGRDKHGAVVAAGAETVLGRDDPLPPEMDVVVDLVGGPRWPDMVAALRRGGRYVTSGAIAGPIVELDLRDLYLRDLTFFGSTYQRDHIMPTVLDHVQSGRLRPLIAERFTLADLPKAQAAFEAKTHVGKIAIEVHMP
ncbi:MAG: zinc-binding dehydrogenase [Pseudomonadota bacterium]